MDGPAVVKKYLAQSWWVPGGNSALGGRSTFMPARKRRAGEMSQSGKENYENANHLVNAHKNN
jgi:hypothetical protein